MEETGKVLKCKAVLDDERRNFIIKMEIDLNESWGQCFMAFNPSTSVLIADILCEGNPERLIGETLRLLPHPRGEPFAPIAISKGMLSQWFYKESTLM